MDSSQASGCSDGELSAMSKTMPIASKSSRQESKMDSLMTRRYGTMPEPLMANRGVELWISSVRDSLASPSASQESEEQIQTSETYGLTSFALLEKSNPDSVFWKTSQGCLPNLMATLGRYSGSWPRAGMMLAGVCYRQPKWERRTREIGCGLWPTLLTRDARGNFRSCQMRSLARALGGSPNPRWLEWFMGWPIGWSKLECLDKDKFRQWLHSHGNCSNQLHHEPQEQQGRQNLLDTPRGLE